MKTFLGEKFSKLIYADKKEFALTYEKDCLFKALTSIFTIMKIILIKIDFLYYSGIGLSYFYNKHSL